MIPEYLLFATIAGVALAAALAVVLWRNLIHCVLWLAALLLVTALVYVTLDAPFLGAIQVMLYAGGVVTLTLFAVMLTRRKAGIVIENETDNTRRWPALLLSGGLFGFMSWAILSTPALAEALPKTQADAKVLARAFLTEHVLSFEVLSVLLLAATVGAIVIARRRDFGEDPSASAQQGAKS